MISANLTQRSSFLATLGYMMQSFQDCSFCLAGQREEQHFAKVQNRLFASENISFCISTPFRPGDNPERIEITQPGVAESARLPRVTREKDHQP